MPVAFVPVTTTVCSGNAWVISPTVQVAPSRQFAGHRNGCAQRLRSAAGIAITVSDRHHFLISPTAYRLIMGTGTEFAM